MQMLGNLTKHEETNLKDKNLLNFSQVSDFISGTFQGMTFFSAPTLETPVAFNELCFAFYLHHTLKLLQGMASSECIAVKDDNFTQYFLF